MNISNICTVIASLLLLSKCGSPKVYEVKATTIKAIAAADQNKKAANAEEPLAPADDNADIAPASPDENIPAPDTIDDATPIPTIIPTPDAAKPAVFAIIKGWLPEWNTFVAEGLMLASNKKLLENNTALTKDMNTLCPGFFSAKSDEKTAFWALLFASITKYESSFNTKSRYLESWGIYSEGLLQLSYGDEQVTSWKPCELNKVKGNIFDPRVNLMCGVSIMRGQIDKRGTIFHESADKAYYWSVLKNKKQEITTTFVNAAKTYLPFCQVL